MKKILLILLAFTSFASFAQAEFPEGIQITNPISTTAPYVNVQESTGVVNKINKSDLIEVSEYASAINLPVTGVAGKIYITLDNNRLYRWTGTIYQELTTDISGKENIANKQNSLVTDGSGIKYPTVDAVISGLALKANDTDVVKLTGNQSITGQKGFSNSTGTGSAIIASVLGGSGNGLRAVTNNIGTAISAESSSSGSSIVAISTGSANNVVSNVSTAGSGFNYVGQNNGVNTYTVDKLGAVTGTSYIKSGATATNILLAGGTDITQASLPLSTATQNALNLKATDTEVVKLTGNQSITGTKTFTASTATANIFSINNSTAQGIYTLNNSSGLGIFSNNISTGTGISSSNTSTGIGIYSVNTSTGSSIVSNTTGTGLNYVGQNNGVNTYTVNNLGATTATSFINSTAPATNALLAGGTTLANPISGTGTTGYLPKFTSAGVLGNSIVNESATMINVAGAARFKEGAGTHYAEVGSDTSYSYFRGGNSGLGTLVYDIAGKGIFMQPFSGNLIAGGLTDNLVDRVQSNGSVIATQYKISALNTAPASATATGTTGEIRITAGFIYVCTATNTWVRTALATW